MSSTSILHEMKLSFWCWSSSSVLVFRIVLRSSDVFSVLRDISSAFGSLSILFIVDPRFHSWTWLILLVPFIFRFERKILRSRSSSKSSRSSTRYVLIHDNFVERCFVVLRVRILIIEFSTDVLIFHSLYSSIEFWYPIRFWQHMERDCRTLWKWDPMEIRHVFCPRRNVLVTCPLPIYWDECIRLEKTMIASGLSSDASYCHRIHSYVISQEVKHVTLLHSQRNRSSSSRWIIIHWMFPSTSIGWRYLDQKRHGHDRNICHNTDEILKVVQQELVLYNCSFCLVVVKITCCCHVRSEIVVTEHTDTQVRKRFGRIEFTRRRFTFISSKSVQHTRLRRNFQWMSSRISLKRSIGLSCQSKVSALFKFDGLIKWFTISRQSDVVTYRIL